MTETLNPEGETIVILFLAITTWLQNRFGHSALGHSRTRTLGLPWFAGRAHTYTHHCINGDLIQESKAIRDCAVAAKLFSEWVPRTRRHHGFLE